MVLASRVVQSLFIVLVPLAPAASRPLALAMILASQALGDPFWTTYEIGAISLRQALTPAAALGRVTGCFQLVRAGLEPLGALAGGLLAASLGVRPALWISVAGLIAGIAWLIFSPLARGEQREESGASP